MSRVSKVIEKYRLLDQTDVRDQELGIGPVMDKGTLNTFVAHDPSKNGKYLEWMIFQAGGGRNAMGRMLDMWTGSGPNDPLAQGPAIEKEFLKQETKGYVDECGVKHPPVSAEEARKRWRAKRPEFFRQFIVGDQDIAVESGFGFYRYWVKHYDTVIETVKLWHEQLPALKASNAELSDPVELDIYAGWSMDGYRQHKAVYGEVSDLQKALRSVRWKKALGDQRFDVVYEDKNVRVIAPLTAGASVKFGIKKWCTSNPTNLEQAMDPTMPVVSHWQNFLSQGPVVYWLWKVPMPEYLWRMAIHLKRSKLKFLTSDALKAETFVDAYNAPGGVSYGGIFDAIAGEDMLKYPEQPGLPSEDLYLKYGKRRTDRAWHSRARGRAVLDSFEKSIYAIIQWARDFDTSRIVVDSSS